MKATLADVRRAVRVGLDHMDAQPVTTDLVDLCEVLVLDYGHRAVAHSVAEAKERLEDRGERYPA